MQLICLRPEPNIQEAIRFYHEAEKVLQSVLQDAKAANLNRTFALTQFFIAQAKLLYVKFPLTAHRYFLELPAF